MLVAGVAAWRVWEAEGGATPALVAGHSLGEYSALVAAGALSLADAAPLVRFRAQAMQDAVPVGVGAMAAVLGLPAGIVIDTCEEVARGFGDGSGEVVEAVNFNDPLQTVIAGSKAAVDAACEALKKAGAKRALILPVSAPFHSSLMRPAAERLKEALASTSFAVPRITLINNIDVTEQSEPDAIRQALYRQAFGPVRWVETLHTFKTRGITHIVECGPGKVLSGMTKRIAPELTAVAVYDPATLAEAQAALA